MTTNLIILGIGMAVLLIGVAIYTMATEEEVAR